MTREEMLTIGISSAIYLLMAVGAYILLASFLRSVMEKAAMLRRLRARRRRLREEGEMGRKLRNGLQTAIGPGITPGAFCCIISTVFLIVFLMASRSVGVVTALILSGAAASMPCMLVWIRLCSVRRRGSHEGEKLVTEFLRQYRMNNFNVYETMEKVVLSSADIKITGRLLSKLLYNLRNTGDPAQIKAATDGFAFGIGTNWSLMLAHDIYIAAEKGTNISLAVEDILVQLREARAMAEERKRINSEAARMTFYMVPFIYCVTVLMAVKYLDVPMGKFMQNQFNTAEGLILFLFILFLFVLNMALIQLVINQRFDY